ncbi:MAG: hypothetical protein WAM14_26895 [Candidatus Nitrosopolaris sp.]
MSTFTHNNTTMAKFADKSLNIIADVITGLSLGVITDKYLKKLTSLFLPNSKKKSYHR